MRKGTHQSVEAKARLSKSLKNYYAQGNEPWNKGKKFTDRTESSATILRRDERYYEKELRINALRGRTKKYYADTERRMQIYQLKRQYQDSTGAGMPRRIWQDEEIAYLYEHYETKTILEIALYLQRSWSSIAHKLNRLNLTTYHKWKDSKSHPSPIKEKE